MSTRTISFVDSAIVVVAIGFSILLLPVDNTSNTSATATSKFSIPSLSSTELVLNNSRLLKNFSLSSIQRFYCSEGTRLTMTNIRRVAQAKKLTRAKTALVLRRMSSPGF
ncbi:hypothetical protein M5K25_023364 [Dendrobium thyrsiflorum]|uniref:Uncharacterized protein n=1 Tax=Dendrobium thyrsiflorum TaxID=117978 RepID=A0ABD0U7Y0_DENTH